MKKLTACALLLTIANICFAQGSIKGKLTDTSGKQPLALATIAVFKAADTALITYRLSNPEGEFRIPNLPLATACRVVISFTGYAAYRKDFRLDSATTLDLGTIALLPSSQTLDEIIVTAERPPVTVRNDTVEFNAASFKTLPTQLVEDLLRKLPGVQVDREGNITANGRRVNRIMVDGKAFFGDDPKMATRNLPANVIEKVQLTNDKDEEARNTTGDLTEVGQVINLTLKKGVKKGWFGKAYAGAGTRNRYEAGGIFNIYRDTLQLSVLGFSNNINRSGFSLKEVENMGGFNRSGFNSISVSSRGGQTGFAINGVSFGGMDAGIARTSGTGFNLNHAPNNRNSLFLQYFYGRTRSQIAQTVNNQQFFSDTVIDNRTITENNRLLTTHNLGAGGNFKPDSLTDITVRAGYAFFGTAEDIAAAVRLNNNKRGLVSRGQGQQANDFDAGDLNYSLYLTRRFRAKKGRSLNLNHFGYFNDNAYNYLTESLNEFFEPVPYQRPFNQLRVQERPSLYLTTSVAYTEPLSKKFTWRSTLRHEYRRDEQAVSIFEKAGSGKYDVLVNRLSTGFVRNQHRVGLSSGLDYKLKAVTLNASLTALGQAIDHEFRNIATPVNFRLFDLLPGVSVRWKQLSANYQQTVNVAQSNYLIPVPDSTNPFMVRVGNPFLRPARRHQLYVNNFVFLQGSATTLNVYASGSFTNNDVIFKRTVNPNGTQSDSAVNADGTIDFYSNIGFGREFKNNQKFIFSFRVGAFYGYNRRKLIVNNRESFGSSLQYGPSLGLGLNWNDKVEFRPTYNPGLSSTRYTDPSFTNLKVTNHTADGELIVRWPKRIVWETAVVYRYTTQVAPGLPKDNVLWNAAVTLLMFKGDVGMLKLHVFDLLNRNNGFYRAASGNQITDQQTNVLQRYGALTFTYNIRNMGAPKKVGGRDRLFLF